MTAMPIGTVKYCNYIIVDNLFTREIQNLINILGAIVHENDTYLATKYNGFKYKSKTYTAGGTSIIVPLPDLSKNLFPAMDKYLLDKLIIDRDKKTIEQLMFTLTKEVDDTQHYRNCIPDSIARFAIDEVKCLSRTVSMEDCLSDNPRAYRQYLNYKLMVDVYSASHLLY